MDALMKLRPRFKIGLSQSIQQSLELLTFSEGWRQCIGMDKQMHAAVRSGPEDFQRNIRISRISLDLGTNHLDPEHVAVEC